MMMIRVQTIKGDTYNLSDLRASKAESFATPVQGKLRTVRMHLYDSYYIPCP